MNQPHAQQFKALHHGPRPLLLTNVWDAASAAMVARMGAPALATSSAALAWSLGHPDGQCLPTKQLLAAVARITRAIDLPLTVDIEAGYSTDPEAVVELVMALLEMGVVGINIEDGDGPVSALVDQITLLRDRCPPDLFINARTDVYLQQLVPKEWRQIEVMKRATAYVAAGADGVFVPGLLELSVIKPLVQGIDAPLNVMLTERPADVREWAACGVARLSTGPAPFLNAYAQLQHWVPQSACVPNHPTLHFNDVNGLFQRA